ncbi:MAG: phosphatase PAP2 family protein [Gemmataceae bacterium]|nr:phosphatase PAP2 family protein [Gemmataceae bacterium]
MNVSLLLGLSVCALVPVQSPVWPGRDAGPSQSPHLRLVDRVRVHSASDFSAEIILHWNEAALLSIKAEKTPPPLAARQLAILHIAVFDAVNSIERKFQPFEIETTVPARTSGDATAAAAAHRVLSNYYPGRTKHFDGLLARTVGSLGDQEGVPAGLELGRSVGKEILAWRADDGSTRDVAHRTSSKAGDWNPTPPKFMKPLAPHWPQLTCFALRRGFQFRSEGPPSLTDKAYTIAFDEVKKLGSKNSTARTADQTEIALFWADGEGTVTPPGHWNRIAQSIARERGFSLVENARLFALLNVAMADVSIACWDCKYHFNFWRPIQGIREADRDGNPVTRADYDWEPLLVTPPFPAYTSGHSSFSGAAATILAAFTGKDAYRFETSSEGLPNSLRKFNGFWAAAEEAGMSRIYGGIHWQFDNTDGLGGGKKIAKLVLEKCMKPVQR